MRVGRAARLAGRVACVLLIAAALLVSCRDRAAPAAPPRGGAEGGAGAGELGARAAGEGGEAGARSPASGGAPARGAISRPLVVACPGGSAPAACSSAGDSSRGVRLIGTLITPGAVLERGVLDLDASGIVSCSACDCGEAGAKLVLDCPDWVISPGLINLHDHLGYSGTPPLSHPDELYEHRSDWRLGENGHAALPFEGGASIAEVLAQELRMVLGGATSIVGAGGRRGFLRNLDLPNLTEGVWVGQIRAETFPLDDNQAAQDPDSCEFGRAPDTSESVASAAAYVAHVGEGTSERAEAELECALGQLDLLGSNSAIVHAMALTRSAGKQLAARGASVIWSPRSNLDLYGSTAPVAWLSSLGVHIALGTDWLASGSMNLLHELRCAERYNERVLHDYFDSYQLWRMVTENAAWALGLEHRFGALAPGLAGDVAVFAATSRHDAYASVIHADASQLRLVLRQGQPLYGAAELIQAFEAGEACEALSVCNVDARVCALETGVSLNVIRSAGEAVYPLVSCGEPPNEPACEAIVSHECPIGEADCPPPPTPPAWDQTDVDADGVPDIGDLCPRVADREQLDADADGRGDACDPCPVPNPGLQPCRQRIAELRAPSTRAVAGHAVEVAGVRVTALRTEGSRGFYVEDGDHAPYSGIFAYTDTLPTVAIGDELVLRGYFESFQGTDQLTQVEVVERRLGGDYAPLLIALGDAADGGRLADAFASMLVRIEDVEVAASNPDAPKDYDETLLVGGLRLDDALYPSFDNQFAVGQRFSAVQGNLAFSFGHRKLLPRGAADLAAF